MLKSYPPDSPLFLFPFTACTHAEVCPCRINNLLLLPLSSIMLSRARFSCDFSKQSYRIAFISSFARQTHIRKITPHFIACQHHSLSSLLPRPICVPPAPTRNVQIIGFISTQFSHLHRIVFVPRRHTFIHSLQCNLSSDDEEEEVKTIRPTHLKSIPDSSS